MPPPLMQMNRLTDTQSEMAASPAVARVLLISPVRNEADHFAEVVQGVLDQERRPDEWIVVDDGSTDGTYQLAQGLLRDVAFATLVRTPADYTTDTGDRNAAGGPDRAWNF